MTGAIGRITAVAAAFVALAGCVPHDSVNAQQADEDVAGASVQQTIDQQYAALLSSWPELHAGASTCPAHLDLSAGKVGHCTLPISGASLPIAVIPGKESGTFGIRPERALFAARRTERDLGESMSRDYGMRLTVACGSPAVRVLAVGTRFQCALGGAGARVRHVDLKVIALDGKLFVYRIKELHSVTDDFGPYLTAHKHGEAARVPGAKVERLISAAGAHGADGQRLPAIAVCPAVVDLTGTKHGRCTASVAGHRLAYAAWIDEPNGINVAPLQVIISTKRVRNEATKQLQAKLRSAGSTDRVSVDCGPDRLAVYAPKDTFPCTIVTANGKSRPLSVTVLDVNGMVKYDVPPLPEP